MVDTLRENKDVFAWTYEEMPRLDPLLVVHKLVVEPTQRLVKQLSQIFMPEIELQVKAKAEKNSQSGIHRSL